MALASKAQGINGLRPACTEIRGGYPYSEVEILYFGIITKCVSVILNKFNLNCDDYEALSLGEKLLQSQSVQPLLSIGCLCLIFQRLLPLSESVLEAAPLVHSSTCDTASVLCLLNLYQDSGRTEGSSISGHDGCDSTALNFVTLLQLANTQLLHCLFVANFQSLPDENTQCCHF